MYNLLLLTLQTTNAFFNPKTAVQDLMHDTHFTYPAVIFEPMETYGLPQVPQAIKGAPQRIFENLRERS